MPRKAKKYHIVYKTTCKISGRFYVGMHSTDIIDDGYLGSGRRLKYSIDKHGKEEHIREILAYCDDRKSLAKKEAEIIDERFLKHPMCMNLIEGGEGGDTYTKENRHQRIEARKNWYKKLTEEEKIELSEKVSSGVNKHIKANPDKIVERNKKIAKIRVLNGYSHSDKTRKKIGDANKNRSQEINDKISKTLTGRKNLDHSKRMTGRKWMTSPDKKESALTKEENINSYLNKGWNYGRK